MHRKLTSDFCLTILAKVHYIRHRIELIQGIECNMIYMLFSLCHVYFSQHRMCGLPLPPSSSPSQVPSSVMTAIGRAWAHHVYHVTSGDHPPLTWSSHRCWSSRPRSQCSAPSLTLPPSSESRTAITFTLMSKI